MRILGYFLIALSTALFAAPISPVPRTARRAHKVAIGANARRTLTLEFITMLADQLRVGNSPHKALRHAAVMHPSLDLEMGSSDEENLTTLRRKAIDGAQALSKVALFLELSNQRGTPLIPALDAIAASIEGELSLEEELQGELAGARATAVLMSVLPLIILIALHPFHFLFGTLVGRIALLASILLNLIGRFWLARITKGAMAVTS